MSAGKNSDFASLLDELIAATPADEAEAAPPHASVDYLSVAEELHSGRIKVSPDMVAAEYRLADAAAEAASEALFAAVTEPLVDELPSIEPDAISRELGLGGNVPPSRSRRPTPGICLQEPSGPGGAASAPARDGQDAGRQHADRRGQESRAPRTLSDFKPQPAPAAI